MTTEIVEPTNEQLSTTTLDPCSDPRWLHLVGEGRGSLFTSPPWLNALRAAYGFDLSADVLLNQAGCARAGIAYAEVHDLRGSRIVSVPFCDYADPILNDGCEWQRLVQPLLERRLPLTLRCRRAVPPLSDRSFVTTGEAAWHATDLTVGEEDMLAGMHPKVRVNVRSALRHGVGVRLSSELDDVRQFHRLHLDLRKSKYRMVGQPLEFFEQIWQQFAPTDSIVVGLTSHEGDIIAGALYLMWDGVLYYKFGASVPARLAVRPNELLAVEAMRYARERGCHLYDWGVSDLEQPGLVNFKRKFATVEQPITRLSHTPLGHDENPDQRARRMLNELVELLTRPDVPDEITKRAGEIVYHVFC